MTTFSSASVSAPLAIKRARRKHWVADIANLMQLDQLCDEMVTSDMLIKLNLCE